MLELQQVSKRFGDAVVLQPTDLVFPMGSTTVLIGPSGCGKSTLLRMIVGLLTPDSGKILFEGLELKPEIIEQSRRRMGYVIQDGGLFPHLSSRQNVGLLARYLGWDQARIDERIRELAELTRLPTAALDRFPSQISGGQRQRVGIMRALMLDPPLVLLDEPMGALDPLVRYDLQEDLREIFQSLKKTVIMVTHDMGEAGFFGDTVILLQGGRIVQRGSIQNLMHTPADPFVSQFIQAQRFPAGV